MMAHVDDYLAGVLRRGEKLGCILLLSICCGRVEFVTYMAARRIYNFLVHGYGVYFLARGRRKRWKVKINLAKMLYKRGGMEKGKGE